MYAVQSIAVVPGEEFGNGLICCKHEFFNNLVSEVSFKSGYRQNFATICKGDF